MNVDVHDIAITGGGLLSLEVGTRNVEAHSVFSDLGRDVVKEHLRRAITGVDWEGLRRIGTLCEGCSHPLGQHTEMGNCKADGCSCDPHRHTRLKVGTSRRAPT